MKILNEKKQYIKPKALYILSEPCQLLSGSDVEPGGGPESGPGGAGTADGGYSGHGAAKGGFGGGFMDYEEDDY